MQLMQKISLITILLFSPFSLVFANQISFSPYADLTINAHWDSQYQDMEPMDLVAMSNASGVKDFHLAFITDAGSCNPAWGGQSSYSVNARWGSNLLNKLRQKGVKYTIAFGGANGSDISNACTPLQLVNALESTISVYQPNGLDFDIENGSANVSKLMQALTVIQNKHPEIKLSFTLPVLPEGLTTQGQSIVKQAQENNLVFTVNIMAMDYGSAYTKPMGEYAIEAANNLYAYIKTLYPEKSSQALWQMIEVTPMIGVNDVNVEQFTLSDVDTLKAFAISKQIAGLSMWSVARDNPCADRWASPICSGNDLQTKPYEFSQRFM